MTPEEKAKVLSQLRAYAYELHTIYSRHLEFVISEAVQAERRKRDMDITLRDNANDALEHVIRNLEEMVRDD